MRVLAFTGIRSDYDIMSGVYRALHADDGVTFGLIVAGAHLSPTFGMSVRHIEADGLPIIGRIESLLDSNTPSSRIKSAAILLQGCLPFIESFAPDLLIYAGDREDVMVGALSGAYLGIPTAHFFGGDHATDGNVDNPVRHAASKLSTFHFVSHEQHARRLQRMGEDPRRIRIVGNPAIDRFVHTPHMDRATLLRSLGRPDWSEYAVVIYHPILGEEANAKRYFMELLEALEITGVRAFINSPNSDAGSRDILSAIEGLQNRENFAAFRNLPNDVFVNLMRHAALLVGNSSAGLLEAPSIPLGVVNVGARQRGRIAAANVIFVDQGAKAIAQAIQEVRSAGFQKMLREVRSPYGNGNVVQLVVEKLKALPLAEFRFKTEDPLT
ncbi:MAG: UDP-N-acetylglucosamine 2-epimerase (hydrolyzing) [Gammaproteobacteria bacterium]|nr:MAG: UDP-N-acetylglucosamine 2-epimerase (hydrolyzing) [Gammaproteobacteria bacterium]